MIEYPCLYSEQKFKKKKRYFDGVLKFFPERKICYLYSSSNTNDSLDSRILKNDEFDKFVSLGLLELEFEKYMTQIEYLNTNPENYTSKPVTTSTLPKLGKFNILAIYSLGNQSFINFMINKYRYSNSWLGW